MTEKKLYKSVELSILETEEDVITSSTADRMGGFIKDNWDDYSNIGTFNS